MARWEKPPVSGVAGKMDRASLKSAYCTKNAKTALRDLIKNIKAKYILLSYNNMAEKGNGRSNAKISDTEIMRILSSKGTVRVFSKKYKAFTAGKSEIRENEERLFLCGCYGFGGNPIRSPFNCIGGKYRLLAQILPLFPKHIGIFADLFSGGCNVGINSDCGRVLFNDINTPLQNLLKTFKSTDKETVFGFINGVIKKYGLSMSREHGYAYYGCESSKGLGNYNRKRFLKLRDDFNSLERHDVMYSIMLYVLTAYSLNNQIRFNSEGKFNLPAGKRDFNHKSQSKLSDFIDRIQTAGYEFLNLDFRKFDFSGFEQNGFVYADPPRLITGAAYNGKISWTENDEKDLLDLLDSLDAGGIRFALSDVLESKENENSMLWDWLSQNSGKYKAVNLSYADAHPCHTKSRAVSSKQALIVNYRI